MLKDYLFTGERVVPNRHTDPLTISEHLIRYAFATRYAGVNYVLDAACGTGYGLKLMRMQCENGIGMDASLEALQCAAELNGNARFHQVDFEKDKLIDFVPGCFDLVTSFETIEHLADPNLFLQGISEILHPAGTFIYSIPLANPSKFHKVVYTFETAQALINQYFDHAELYIQRGIEIVRLQRLGGSLESLNQFGTFIIGVCRKKIV